MEQTPSSHLFLPGNGHPTFERNSTEPILLEDEPGSVMKYGFANNTPSDEGDFPATLETQMEEPTLGGEDLDVDGYSFADVRDFIMGLEEDGVRLNDTSDPVDFSDIYDAINVSEIRSSHAQPNDRTDTHSTVVANPVYDMFDPALHTEYS